MSTDIHSVLTFTLYSQEKARATSCTANLPTLLYLVYPKLLHAWLRRGTTKATAPKSLIFYANKWMPRTVNRLTACLVSAMLLACSGPEAGPKLRTLQFFLPLSAFQGGKVQSNSSVHVWHPIFSLWLFFKKSYIMQVTWKGNTISHLFLYFYFLFLRLPPNFPVEFGQPFAHIWTLSRQYPYSIPSTNSN